MTDPNDLFSIALLLAAAIFASGVWSFHRRLRNRQSLPSLCAVLAFLVAIPGLAIVTQLVLAEGDRREPGQFANWLVLSSEVFVPGLLALLGATTFWLAVHSIARQARQPSGA